MGAFAVPVTENEGLDPLSSGIDKRFKLWWDMLISDLQNDSSIA